MTEPDPINELSAAIEKAGTQTKFAAECGLPQSYISAVMRKERPPSDKLLSILGLKRVLVRADGIKQSVTVAEAELSVRTGNIARRTWGDDMLLSDLCAKSDDDLRSAGFMRKSIKEIREIGEWL